MGVLLYKPNVNNSSNFCNWNNNNGNVNNNNATNTNNRPVV